MWLNSSTRHLKIEVKPENIRRILVKTWRNEKVKYMVWCLAFLWFGYMLPQITCDSAGPPTPEAVRQHNAEQLVKAEPGDIVTVLQPASRGGGERVAVLVKKGEYT